MALMLSKIIDKYSPWRLQAIRRCPPSVKILSRLSSPSAIGCAKNMSPVNASISKASTIFTEESKIVSILCDVDTTEVEIVTLLISLSKASAQ